MTSTLGIIFGGYLEAYQSLPHSMTCRKGTMDSHIVIDLHFGEHAYRTRLQPKRQIPTPIPTSSAHTLVLLDPRHHHIHHLAQKTIHILALQLRFHRHSRDILRHLEVGNAVPRFANGGSHIGHCLQDHARDMQVGAIPVIAGADDMVDDDFLEAGDVAESYRAFHKGEDCTAAGAAQRAVFVIGRGVIPAAETLTGGTGKGAGWVMGVEQRQEVGGQGACVGLLQAREGKGARNEEAGVGG